MSLRHLWLVFVLSTLFAGCTPLPTRPLPEDRDAAWHLHRAEVEVLDQWRLNGSLAVRAHREGGQANIDWRQQGSGYDIRLAGPLGSGGARLYGGDDGATLALSNGERLSDREPTKLLHDRLGWWIPVDALRFWALGLPAPTSAAQWSLDSYGRLATLEQDGWTVRFANYGQVSGVDLPGKLEITGQNAEVRLVVRRWTLRTAQAK
jgi:outer membrane lipoprotein LolB